jgi:hypothetical protein
MDLNAGVVSVASGPAVRRTVVLDEDLEPVGDAYIVHAAERSITKPAPSSTDGIRRTAGSAATLPASTTTLTVVNVGGAYSTTLRGIDPWVPEGSRMYLEASVLYVVVMGCDAIVTRSATTSASGRLASTSCVQLFLRSGSTLARSSKIIARSSGVFP